MNLSEINSNSKGFTLVEFAIVLIVIGIMLGITVKGKDFIEHAKMVKAVNNVKKIETAFNIYLSKHNFEIPDSIDRSVPGGSVFQIDPYVLINAGLITRDAFMYKNTYVWDLVKCNAVNMSNGDKAYTPNDIDPDFSEKVCIYSGLYDPATDWVVPNKTYTSSELVCNIEKLLDDLTINDGEGRRTTDMTGLYSLIDEDYNDCDSTKNKLTRYMYRVL